MHRAAVMLASAALLASACGLGADDVEPGEPAPGPTVTLTATETVTASPPVEEPTPTAPAGGACGSLEGGEELAFIFVTEPPVGTVVSSGFQVVGCSNTFEATYRWELLGSDGNQLAADFGTATCGTGCVGEFAFTVTYDGVDDRQVGTLRVFTTSPADGSETDVNSIPLILEP